MKCQTYQRGNNARGCKVKTKQAKDARNATSSIKPHHGDDCVPCSSSGSRCVSSVKVSAKWSTTSSQSNKVVNHWSGEICKRCATDATTSNRARKRINNTSADAF